MRERVLRKKQGISPVIATVLLVAMVVVIGLIIFLWFRGITEEAVTKFGGRNIELVCEDVEFLSDYSATGILSVSNIGNVPIFGLKAKISEQGIYETLDMKDLLVGWPEIGLRQGGTFSGNLIEEFDGANQVLLIPVLMGTSAQGDQTYVCEDRYGQDLMI
jgi:flagellin-like protein